MIPDVALKTFVHVIKNRCTGVNNNIITLFHGAHHSSHTIQMQSYLSHLCLMSLTVKTGKYSLYAET